MDPRDSVGCYYERVSFLIFFFAHFVGVVGSIDDEASAALRGFQAHIQQLRATLKQHGLPSDLERRVVNYYSFQHARNQGADEAQLLKELPHILHVDIMLHLFEKARNRHATAT